MLVPSLSLAAALAGNAALDLKLEDRKLARGDTLFAIARLSEGEIAASATATWQGRTYPLSPEAGGRVPILLPVGLDAPDRLELLVRVATARGEEVAASAEIKVVRSAAPAEETWDLAAATAAGPGGNAAAAERGELGALLASGSGSRRFAGDFDRPIEAKLSGNFAARRGPAPGGSAAGDPGGRPGGVPLPEPSEEAPVHRGLDFLAPPGASVRTPQAARVVATPSLPLLGETVVLDHGLGVFSVLAHLDAAAVRAGDRIGRHTVIGWSGQSGACPGPLLHYALFVQGEPVDPRGFEDLPRWLEATPPGESSRALVSPGPPPQPTPPPPPGPLATTAPRPVIGPSPAPASAQAARPGPSSTPTPPPLAIPGPTTVATPPLPLELTLEDLLQRLETGIEARLPGVVVEIESTRSASAKPSEREPSLDLTVRLAGLDRIPFFTAVETTAYVAGELTSLTRVKTGRMIVTNGRDGQSVTLLTRDARQLWRERTGLATPVPRGAEH